jgi:putative transposase
LPKGAGVWASVKVLKKAEIFQKNDERILGDGGFVEKVLSQAREKLDHRYRIRAQGLTFEPVLDRVKELTSVEPELILTKDRRLETVRTRSLACYLAVEELGLTQPEISLKLGMTQAAVSIAVRRGAQFAVESECRL